MPLPLDHSKAAATISFSGLLLFRKAGPDDRKRCEVNVLSCDRHKLTLTIQEVTFAADGTTKLRSKSIDPNLDLAEDISIEVKDPSERGVEFCKDVATPFNRQTGEGNDEDIRWVLDFENVELNGNPIDFDPQGTKHFSPAIYIDHGKLYTQLKTEDVVLAREDVDNTNDRVFLGKAAFRVGADLVCNEGTVIELRNAGQNAAGVSLKQGALKQYQISIENDCEIPNDLGIGSDFRFYYDALTTADRRRYDLRRVIDSGAVRAENDPLTGTPPTTNFSSDNFPRTCLPGGGGSSS